MTGQRPRSLFWLPLCHLAAVAGMVALVSGVVLFGASKFQAALFLILGLAVVTWLIRDLRQIGLALLGFTTPFYLGRDFVGHPRQLGGLHTLGLYVVDVIAVLLLLLQLLRGAREGEFALKTFGDVLGPAMLWLVAGAFSLLNARDIAAGALQLAGLFKLLIVSLAVANSVHNRADVQIAIVALLCGAALQGILGTLQTVKGAPLGLGFLGEPPFPVTQDLAGRVITRAQGTIGHPNGYAMFMSSTLGLAGSVLLLHPSKGMRLFAMATLAVGIPGLISSLSRGGWISFGLVILFAIALMAIGKRIRLTWAVGVTLVLLVGALSILVTSPIVLERFTSSDKGSAQSRLVLARGAMAMVKEYPIFGIGVNNYALYMREYDPVSYYAWRGIAIVHNIWLLILAESGFLGLAAWSWFLLAVYRRLWHALKHVRDSLVWMSAVGLFCALSALLIHGMADYALLGDLRLLSLFWFIVGLICGLEQAANATNACRICEGRVGNHGE